MNTRVNEFQTIFSRHLYLRCTCDSFCFFPNKYGLFSEFLNCFLFLKWSKSSKIFFSLVTLSRCENMKMTFMSLRKKIYHQQFQTYRRTAIVLSEAFFYPEKKSSQKEKSKSCYIIAFLFLAPSLILISYFSFALVYSIRFRIL